MCQKQFQQQFFEYIADYSTLLMTQLQFSMLARLMQRESLESVFKDLFDTQHQQTMNQIDQPSQQEESIFDILLKDNPKALSSFPSQSQEQPFSDTLTSVPNKELQARQIREYLNQSQQKNIKQTTAFLNQKSTQKVKVARDSYPTKNLLVNFKKSHFDFLKQKLGKKFTNHRFVQRLMKKKGISMKQYQRIYRTEEFRPALAQYFASRVIFRDMMCSKMDVKQKKTFVNKLHVFEEAFNSGSFTHIN